MSRTSILAILASVGVTFAGTATADAVAFARAIQSSDADQLLRFTKLYPESIYRNEAIKIADKTCIGNWVNAGCTTPDTGRDATGAEDGPLFAPRPRESYGA
jgi:hypothetical protein